MLEVWKRRVTEMMQKEKDIHGGLFLPETRHTGELIHRMLLAT
jgi:hypothetical protein